MQLFSSPSCMKCKSFQNCSPSALGMIKSFTPCHRASFGVGPQPPGRIWGERGMREMSHRQCDCWPVSSDAFTCQGPSRPPASFSGGFYAPSICQQHGWSPGWPSFWDFVSVTQWNLLGTASLLSLPSLMLWDLLLPTFHIGFNESRNRYSCLITSISLCSEDVSG